MRILPFLEPQPLSGSGSLFPPQAREILSQIFAIMAGQPQEALSQLDAASLQAWRRHRLTPWLYGEVARRGWKHYIPSPPLLQELRQDYLVSLMIAARQSRMVSAFIQDFSRRGLDFILLKGADLRHRLYGDPAARPMDDLDVLIDPGDLPRARRVLADLGFRLTPEYADLSPAYWELLGDAIHYLPPPQGEICLDLHWEIGALLYFYRLPFALLRAAAVPYSLDGLPVSVLSPEDLIICLCLNAQKDPGLPVLRQILDLVLALSRLPVNWPALLDRTRSFRCQRPVYLILRELAAFAPHLVPREALAALAAYRPSLAELMVLHGRLRYLTLGIPSFYRHRNLRDWLKVVKATLWPEARYLAALSGRPDRLAYLKDLLGKRMRD
jgi:hypothetical protein